MLYVYIIHYILKYVKHIIQLHSFGCAFIMPIRRLTEYVDFDIMYSHTKVCTWCIPHNGRRSILLPETGVLNMENVVTWSDLFQFIIAIATVGTLIVSIVDSHNKRK